MNPYSGEIAYFKGAAEVPRGWLVLTEEEARQYLTLPLDLRLQKYIKAHSKDKCKSCGCWLANHNLRKFKECAANELANFETARLEEMLVEKNPFAQLPEYVIPEFNRALNLDNIPSASEKAITAEEDMAALKRKFEELQAR